MEIKLRTLLTGLVLIIILFFILKTANASGYSLSIQPTIIKIRAKSSALVKTEIKIKNLSDNPVELGYVLKPFVAENSNSGQIKYILYKDYTSKEASFLQRVKILEGNQATSKIILSPKQEKNLTLSIDIPKEEESIDYYFSLVFLTQNEDNPDSSYSQIIQGIATNVLVSMNPQAHKASIKQFSASPFLWEGPVKFTIEVENMEGNFVDINGYILITNIFGQTVGRINLKPRSILGESTAKMISREKSNDAVWPETFLLGSYKARLYINYENSPTLLREIIFISLPVRLIIILTIIGFFAILIKKRLKTV